MNVLIICTEKLPVPAIRGGAIQTYIDGSLPALKKNHNITVLGRSDQDLSQEETRDGVRYFRVEGGLLELYRENVAQFLKDTSEKYDLIHIFNRPRLINAVRDLAPTSKIVLSMHNDMFKPEKIDHEEGASAVKKVDKIITISNYIAETIQGFFPEAEPKLQTIYSGVDLDRFVPAYSTKGQNISTRMRKEHNLTSKKVILYAGRISPNKGLDVLIRAIPDLVKKHKNVALVIMGSKWFSDDSITDYIAYVRALAERLPIPVIQTGFVAPDQIQDWFVASDIFVCTSQWQEPLARVHYEAMAAGLPIITTNRGGNSEVIEPSKNGILVEQPADTDEFVKHLSYLLSNPSLAKSMGRHGRNLAEKHYTWDRVVNDISAVWEEMEHAPAHDEQLEETEALKAAAADIEIDPEAETEDSVLSEPSAAEAETEDSVLSEPPAAEAETEEAVLPEPSAAEAETEDSVLSEPLAAEAETEDSLLSEPLAAETETEDSLLSKPPAAEAETEEAVPAEAPAFDIEINEADPSEPNANEIKAVETSQLVTIQTGGKVKIVWNSRNSNDKGSLSEDKKQKKTSKKDKKQQKGKEKNKNRSKKKSLNVSMML
ncbi:glycosyltransferase family 4 protein [Salsuginibacillus kocurii]|uniref:glycosyltransferase family 4 protein n=1 Tax=Salsuginibacillus kocurii TaxID=427078 RepID=UPI000363F1D4|nr:glycosyltransferase family 4 protein [Salsuginibacillus kocurii]